MTQQPPRRATTALRRYPALGFLGIAGVLALMLPTALRVPLSNPSSSAEVAPVSGRSDQPGSLSDLNGASSGGLGSGAGSGGAGRTGAGEAGAQSQLRRRPASTKACVGPPSARRQTEDPLSPTCVPFFEGDNGGATSRGVTKDEVVVAVYFSPDSVNKTIEFLDWGKQDNFTATNESMIGEAFASFFNARYQTYNRTVHFYGVLGHDYGAGTDGYVPAVLRNSVLTIEQKLHPFALVPALSLGNDIVADAASKYGIVSVADFGFSHTFLKDHAPLVYSYLPELEDEAALTADFICTKLSGRPPRRGNVNPLASRRTFGILASDRPSDPQFMQLAQLIQGRLRDRCGESAPIHSALNENDVKQCQSNNQLAMTQLRQDGVTTVIAVSNDAICFTEASAYSPEWFVPGSYGSAALDRNASARAYGTQWDNAMGITFDLRRGRQAEQSWAQAVGQGCPACPAPQGNYDFVRLYQAESMLLYGIQAAGPKLAASSFDRGLHAIPARPSPNPSTPAAYFAPGGYSYLHDAVEIWWDRTGADATTGQPGCYRLPDAGQRHRVGEFSPGDTELFQANSNQPCQGSPG